jgi:hypothetical protein
MSASSSAASAAKPAASTGGKPADGTFDPDAPVSNKVAEASNLAFQLSIVDDYVSAADKTEIKGKLLKILEEESESVCRNRKVS